MHSIRRHEENAVPLLGETEKPGLPLRHFVGILCVIWQPSCRVVPNHDRRSLRLHWMRLRYCLQLLLGTSSLL